MSDSTRIAGPVEISDDSRYRVAFDLMERISQWENKDQHPRTRAYWLKLYSQCRGVVIQADTAEEALKR